MKNKTSNAQKPDRSPYVYQKDKKMDISLDIRELPWTDKQKELIQLLQDKKTQIVLCKGPAGTAKTLLAVYAGLNLLNISKVSEIYYIRVPVESSVHNLGFLPGEAGDKMMPYLYPLMDKIHELLAKDQVKYLLKENKIQGMPIGFMRGLSLNATYVIGDEAQNMSVHDLLLVMTRLGKFSKMILTGDVRQSDVKNSGFHQVYSLFDTQEAKDKGIHTFSFGIEDIVRSEVLSFIIEKFEALGK